MVTYAKSLCDDVEFSPEDAGRSEPDFGDNVYAEFLLDGVLRGDFEQDSARFAVIDRVKVIAVANAGSSTVVPSSDRTMTVSMAVMELDLTESQTIVFRNAAHGGLSVVYRRPDGNIGWIDPERTKSLNGSGANGTAG